MRNFNAYPLVVLAAVGSVACGGSLSDYRSATITVGSINGTATIDASIGREGGCSDEQERLSVSINGETVPVAAEEQMGAVYDVVPAPWKMYCRLGMTRTIAFEDDGVVEDLVVVITDNSFLGESVEHRIVEGLPHTYVSRTGTGRVAVGGEAAFTVNPPVKELVQPYAQLLVGSVETIIDSPSSFRVAVTDSNPGLNSVDVTFVDTDFACPSFEYCAVTSVYQDTFGVVIGD